MLRAIFLWLLCVTAAACAPAEAAEPGAEPRPAPRARPNPERPATCPGPYMGWASDGRCVWSCGEGTQPSRTAPECICQPGLVQTGTDKFGRRVCTGTPTTPPPPPPPAKRKLTRPLFTSP